jgi:bifunctional DNase/RNase
MLDLWFRVDGFDLPLRMVVGAAEAMAILTAAQERRSRRPVTHEAWSSSLAAVGWKVT